MVQNLRRCHKWGIVFGSDQPQTLQSVHKLNYKKIPFTQSPLEIFSKLQKSHETAYLLESIEGPKKLAQYSFIGFAPQLTVEVKNGDTTVRNEKTGEATQEKTSDPLHIIKKLVKYKPLQTANSGLSVEQSATFLMTPCATGKSSRRKHATI